MKPKFHPFMNEMTISVEKEFERDGVTMIRGVDKKGRRFVAPKGWLDKPYKNQTFGVPAEPPLGTYVTVKFPSTAKFPSSRKYIYQHLRSADGVGWVSPGSKIYNTWEELNHIATVEVLVVT